MRNENGKKGKFWKCKMRKITTDECHKRYFFMLRGGGEKEGWRLILIVLVQWFWMEKFSLKSVLHTARGGSVGVIDLAFFTFTSCCFCWKVSEVVRSAFWCWYWTRKWNKWLWDIEWQYFYIEMLVDGGGGCWKFSFTSNTKCGWALPSVIVSEFNSPTPLLPSDIVQQNPDFPRARPWYEKYFSLQSFMTDFHLFNFLAY